MFNVNIKKEVTAESILNKIGELALWEYYCTNFKEVDKSFKSEFYKDNNPSCRIYNSIGGRLYYKDFGTNERYTIFQYIQAKYTCTFIEALNIVINDFKLGNNQYISLNKDIQTRSIEEKLLFKVKPKILVQDQAFTLVDYEYWNQYAIPLTLLQEYSIFSAKEVHLIKPDKTTVFKYSNENPIYAYRFISNGEYTYKIYKPYAEKQYKWLSNCNSSIIQGYDQLSNNIKGPIILTKSLKDVLCYRVLGYNAISLQSETNKLPENMDVIVNYDNDDEGIKQTTKLVEKYNFKSFFIDNHKDLSDYIKYEGLDSAKEVIKNKINE